jgi:hypothetical protein
VVTISGFSRQQPALVAVHKVGNLWFASVGDVIAAPEREVSVGSPACARIPGMGDDLEQRLAAAQARARELARSLSRDTRDAGRAAREEQLAAERDLAAARGEPYAQVIRIGPRWDVGAPLPHLVSSVHPRHSDAPFRQLHHYVLVFHDEMLEVLAHGIKARLVQGTMREILAGLTAGLIEQLRHPR